ncbi:hypothetical protein D5F01_LYC03405 [Larimichthys crocea]|uniref:G-protein coupled receptors family 1 profile domain-containing protein n=1 Tax=Larimichthys crocea TaxID=215358 RepID=A0A6G0J5Z0_LARCR|nr:hypothetical protein D5F01_LYC03405 [Larimichthys crocea]
MNVSSSNVTVVLQYRDSVTKAVIKNVIVLVLGITINFIDASLIHTFCKHQIFYMNPRYILFIHLVVNDMIQVTVSVSLFLISYTIYKLNVSVCCALVLLTLYATANTPLNLACMAVECYIAVCMPLRHVQICTIQRTLILIGLIWTVTSFNVLSDLFITLATQPLDFFHSQMSCIRRNVFPSPLIPKKRDITYSVFLGIVRYADSFSKAVTKNVIVVFIGISINYINASLIHTFSKHQILYTNPRYILFVHLMLNDMIQVSLAVILFVISYTIYRINVSVCCVFILLALFTTENTPLNLACMAVECYIAVCMPLRHVEICTIKRTLMLIGLIWTTTMLSVISDLFITFATEPLDFFHSQVFCLRETAFPSPLIVEKRVLPRSISPFIYGIRDNTFRRQQAVMSSIDILQQWFPKGPLTPGT